MSMRFSGRDAAVLSVGSWVRPYNRLTEALLIRINGGL